MSPSDTTISSAAAWARALIDRLAPELEPDILAALRVQAAALADRILATDYPPYSPDFF